VGNGNDDDGYQDMLANCLQWALTPSLCDEVAQNYKNGQPSHKTGYNSCEKRQKKNRRYESHGEYKLRHECCDGGASDLP